MCPPTSLHSTRTPLHTPARTRSAVGLTALTTDHWIVPSGAALPFVEHAGLWKVCFTTSPTEAEGRATADVDSFARIEDWWRTVDDAFLQIDDDQARLARDTEKGCTRRVAEFYGHVWGNDFVAWLQIIRAFSLLFLYAGFLKILVVSRTYVLTTRGRWLSSAFASFLAIVQTSFGEAAWFLVLAIIKKAQDDAPSFLDRGTFASYEGWSFWAFFAAVHFAAVPVVVPVHRSARAAWTSEERGSASGKRRRRDRKSREQTDASRRARKKPSPRASRFPTDQTARRNGRFFTVVVVCGRARRADVPQQLRFREQSWRVSAPPASGHRERARPVTRREANE